MKAGRLSMDIINTLPSNIIETILSILPIKDAARTSTLSKTWRYNWHTIPKLHFNEEDFEAGNQSYNLELMFKSQSERKRMSKRCKMFHAIYQILLVHPGPIHVFSLSMDADDTCVEVDHIIHHLSRNIYNLKKFKLHFVDDLYKVPSSIFSLHQLTELCLQKCVFNHDPKKFTGFCSLTSLYLDHVNISPDALVHLISNSPLLKSVTLIMSLEDLIDFGFTIFDLFKSLPLIEHLTIWDWVIQFKGLVFDPVPRELPISLVHLKYLSLKSLSLRDKYGLPFLALLMRCAPNLEKIKLQTFEDGYKKFEIDVVDYSGIWLEHLHEFEIEDFANSKPEMGFVKVVLAKSPVLKKVGIYHKADMDEESKMLTILLRSPHASPDVDIIVEQRRRGYPLI